METGHILSTDNTELFYRYLTKHNPLGSVLIVHGYAEHSGRYGHVMDLLHQQGLAVYAVDLRGHGYSQGQRGYIDHIEQYLHDVDTLVNHIKHTYPAKPFYLLGHSMGGLVSTLYTAAHGPKVDALALSCPLYAIKVKVPYWKEALGKVMSEYWPRFAMSNLIDPNLLSHDPKMVEAYQHDPLVFQTVTARWFDEINHIGQRLNQASEQIHCPLLMQLATHDQIVDYQTAYQWFDACIAENKTRLVYDGYLHEIYNESKREKPLSDLCHWLQKIHSQYGAQKHLPRLEKEVIL